MIDAGQIPASVIVFVSSAGGPFVDSECIDASGGTEWFDTFVGTTLVPFVDANFRTIATASARTLLGFSQGGFCAANVLLHHPSLFHQSVSFSGYFYAAPMLGVAASALAAYAGNRGLELANSPALIARDLPAALRASIAFTLVGDPSMGILGRQLTQFAALARHLGYGVTVFDTRLGHSWLAVRALLPSALVAVAVHQAAEGIF
jgi:enterochelin esterase-like enzyme